MTRKTFPADAWGIGITPRRASNRLTSAELALVRLVAVVAADRAAVPCGRWSVVSRANPGFEFDRPYLPPAMNRKLKKTVLRWRVRR